jgi:uncharacterized membrane protein YtjA (UPF0391 family)
MHTHAMNPSETGCAGSVYCMVQAELAAAEACAVALHLFEGRPAAKELRRIQQEHREAANELRLHDNNSTSSRGAGTWRKLARTILSLAQRLSSAAALRSLYRAEDACFRLYKDAVFEKDVPVECQALIWSTLLPRLEAHRSSLNRLQSDSWRPAFFNTPKNHFSLNNKESPMLRMAVVFLIIALLAAFMGFGLVADFSYTAAKILFFVFLVLAILSLIGGAVRRPLD